MHGWVLSHSVKMSKSLGNAIEPVDLIEGKIEIITEEQKEELKKQAAFQKTSKFTEHKKTTTINKKSKKDSEQNARYLCDDKRWSNVKGIETFRFFCGMAAQPGNDLNFDYKEYVDTFKVLNTYWNCYVFAQEKMNLNNFNPSEHKINYEELSLEDRWILSKTNSVINKITELFDKYFLPEIPRTLQDYIMNDLSRWYITLIRPKVELSSEAPDKTNTLAVLWDVLYKLLLLLAPINPMITEKIYQLMLKPHLGKTAKKSIHLQSWPKVEKKYINKELEENMEFARKIVDAVRSLKSENKIKLRWPSKALYILPKEKMPKLQFEDLIKEACNVFELIIVNNKPTGNVIHTELAECELFLDLEESKQIQQMRIIKDLIRTIQFLRKQNNFSTGEKIILTLSTTNDFAKSALEDFKDLIISKVTASPLNIVSENITPSEEEVFHEFHICLNENCYSYIKSKQAENVLSGKSYICNYCEKSVTRELMGKIQIKFKRI